MFGVVTNAVIQNIGAAETLISNSNLDIKMELLTLVKVSKRSFCRFPKYTRMMCTLHELMEEETFTPDEKEEVLLESFMTHKEISGNVEVGGGHEALGTIKATAKADAVDGQVEPVDIKKKETNLQMIRKMISGRKIRKEKVKGLKLKKNDILAFVYKKVYNSGPVTLTRHSCLNGSISASYQKMINVLFEGKKKTKTDLKIPKEATFAYGLMEIMLEDELLEISYEDWTHRRGGLDLEMALRSLAVMHASKVACDIRMEKVVSPQMLGDSLGSKKLQVVRKEMSESSMVKKMIKEEEVVSPQMLGDSLGSKKLQVVRKEMSESSMVKKMIKEEEEMSASSMVKKMIKVGEVVSPQMLGDSLGSKTLQVVRKEIQMKEPLLKLLMDLPESTRCDLLKNLNAVLEEEDALSLLEDTLEESSEGESECLQSQVVSSFLELINVSNVSMAVKHALHMLVSVMDTLPDGILQPLTSCGPEPLKVLSQMVDSLKDGEVKVPESLPDPLQKGEELHRAVELICSTNEELAELSGMWGRPPEVLLEVLALTVLGLNMLQPTE